MLIQLEEEMEKHIQTHSQNDHPQFSESLIPVSKQQSSHFQGHFFQINMQRKEQNHKSMSVK